MNAIPWYVWLVAVVLFALLLWLVWLNLRARADVSLMAQDLAKRLEALNERTERELRDAIHTSAQSHDSRLLQLREATGYDARLNREESALSLKRFSESNDARLAEVRQTVDEKLHATLEQRLGESFKLVSDRLEMVHRGLGEMHTLAAGVGDLKRVLTNVKTRGIWGEVQLGNLLEQVLIREQYETNIATIPGSNERVEFAIKLPGTQQGAPVWLPIDAKFPREDYERLLDAQDRADQPAAELAGRMLEQRIKAEARSIRDKYMSPPHTTDFALLFLPTEGLYAEVLRRPGLAEELQRSCRVVLAGPTSLAALLNSLQMGFKTLAIEQRSSEVWHLLGAVKTEFGKFGDVLAKTKKQLDSVSHSLGDAQVRTRVIERKLQVVEGLGETQSQALLGLPEQDIAPPN
jgi:DNA recombination protein RmuC